MAIEDIATLERGRAGPIEGQVVVIEKTVVVQIGPHNAFQDFKDNIEVLVKWVHRKLSGELAVKVALAFA